MWPDDLSDLYLELRLILRRTNRSPRGRGDLSISELSRLLSRKSQDALRSAGASLRQCIAEEDATFELAGDMRDTATVSLRPDVPLEQIPLQYGLDVLSQDLRAICQGKGPCLLSNVGNLLSKTPRFALHLHGMRLKDFVEITPAFKLTRCAQCVDQTGNDPDYFLALEEPFRPELKRQELLLSV